MKTSYYLWFDTEYTTLDMDRAELLQVALVATDASLKRVRPASTDINLYISLEGRTPDPWVVKNLPDVLAKCKAPEAVSVDQADEQMAAYVDAIFGKPSEEIRQRPILGGNSVHADWFLARKFLPMLYDRVHYRLLDVTSVKLEWLRHFGGTGFDKDNSAMVAKYFKGSSIEADIGPHDAYYDVQASIAELAFYRSRLSKKKF